MQLEAGGEPDVDAEVAEGDFVDVDLRGAPTDTGAVVERACAERVGIHQTADLEPRARGVVDARAVLGEDEVEDRGVDSVARPVVTKARAERRPTLEPARYD